MDKCKYLTCCCCGELTRGRQWWNHDNGFGICGKCIKRIEVEEPWENLERCYGVEGIHYNVGVEND